MLMYSYQITNVPRWVAAKLQSAITKNMTLPSCADIPLPHLLPIDHPATAHALPAFLAALRQGLPFMCLVLTDRVSPAQIKPSILVCVTVMNFFFSCPDLQ